MRGEAWREVRDADRGRRVVGKEHLQLVEVSVTHELADDGVVEAADDAVVLVGPLV